LRKIKAAGLGAGLLSNFDNVSAARRLLDQTGLAPLLDAAMISGEEGFRKPAGRLYLKAAGLLGAAPGEVLFVGDNFEADVSGPLSVGMPAAWLNPKGDPPPGGAVPPDGEPPPYYDIRGLDEVLEILGI
jgi:putative hydrolase of the HAD superfamily